MIKVVRMNTFENSVTKAFVDINFNSIIIKGLRVVEGKKGLFIAYPSEKDKSGKYYDTVIPATQTVKIEIEDVVLAYYKENTK